MGNHILYFTNLFILVVLIGKCGDPDLDHRNLPTVLYNDPSGDFIARGSHIENTFVKLLDRAERTIDMAVYNFDCRPILNALVRAQKRGVSIRAVGDSDELNTAGYQAMLENQIDLRVVNPAGIQHNKFILIDGKDVISGTGNFTRSDIYHNDNNFLIFQNADLVNRFQFEFDQLFSGFYGNLKSSNFSPGTQEENHASVFFSPQEGELVVQKIISRIDQAKEAIYYMIFAFSHDEIASALSKAARRGVKIYGIHDSGFINGVSQEAPRMYTTGIKESGTNFPEGPFIHSDGNENTIIINGFPHGGKLHCKTMIIDPESETSVAITGSFNWSKNAVENNDENLFIITDHDSIQILYNQWKRIWNISQGLENKISQIQGSVSTSQDIIISEILSVGIPDEKSLNSNDDYIEIFNRSSRVLDLSNWTITWEEDGYFHSYTFPIEDNGTPMSNSHISPGEFRIIYGLNSGQIYNASLDSSNFIKIPAAKNFSIPDSEILIGLYDRSMQLIDSAHLTWIEKQDYSDSTLKLSASMNRRLQPDGKPSSGWYPSQLQCRSNVCREFSLRGSPGYSNDPASPIQTVSIQFQDRDTIHFKFSGDVSSCTKLENFKIAGDNISYPIHEILTSQNTDDLFFTIPGLVNPDSTYSMKGQCPLIKMSDSMFFFNGYNTGNTENAVLKFNELSLENANDRDWLELLVEKSGNTNGIRIEYSDQQDKNVVYEFSQLNLKTGDIILLFFKSSKEENMKFSMDRSPTKGYPLKIYSTHPNLNRGDGILFLGRNKDVNDILFYSNRDGNIASELMHGQLTRIYFNYAFQKVLQEPISFPVNQWNDDILQKSAIRIPASGVSRIINKTSGHWEISPEPSPGIR